MTHIYQRPCFYGPCTQKGMDDPGFCVCKQDRERIVALERALQDVIDIVHDEKGFSVGYEAFENAKELLEQTVQTVPTEK